MNKYTLKQEFKGLSISKNIFPIGLITLDTNIISESDYEKYFKLGFHDIFNIEDEPNEDEPITNSEAKPNVVIKYYTNEMNSNSDEENIKTQDTNGESIKPKQSRKSKK